MRHCARAGRCGANAGLGADVLIAVAGEVLRGAGLQNPQRGLSKRGFQPRHLQAQAGLRDRGAGALGLAFAAVLPAARTQNAIANGDTRTIYLYHVHTGESIAATFRVDGQYDRATLEKLNWFLRDWRSDAPTKMNPKLFDVIWETYRETGSRQPIHIVSAYRSPETNAMLRRRSRAVAEHSQHILGKAMDMHYTDVPMSKVREIAMRLQRGGGSSSTPSRAWWVASRRKLPTCSAVSTSLPSRHIWILAIL